MNDKIWKPSNFAPNPENPGAEHKEYFKSVLHPPVENAFHSSNFGSGNKQNIYRATPGENLHMMQLGVSKRTIETFPDTIRRSYKDGNDNINFTNANKTTDDYGYLCLRYGG